MTSLSLMFDLWPLSF